MRSDSGEVQRGIPILDPRFLVALVVLLANDHWGKASHPGLITGKLSDFAGMIVLPVLLGSILTTIRRSNTAHVNGAAVLISGLFMIAIKTSQAAAGAVVGVLEALTFTNQQIIVDPYDLAGLAILPLAYLILTSPITVPWKAALRPLKWTAFTIALGACMATSSEPPSVWPNLEVEGESIVARYDGYSYDGDLLSTDDGRTWDSLTEEHPAYIDIDDPEHPSASWDPANFDHGPVCLASDSTVCVRINQGVDIEQSLDGGRTWTLVADWDYSEWWLGAGTGEWTLFRSPRDVVATEGGSILVSYGPETPLRLDGETRTWPISQSDINPMLTGWLIAVCLIQTYIFSAIRWFRSGLKFGFLLAIPAVAIAGAGFMIMYDSVGPAGAVAGMVAIGVIFVSLIVWTTWKRTYKIEGTPLISLGPIMVERGFVALLVIFAINWIPFAAFDRALISWEAGHVAIAVSSIAALLASFIFPLELVQPPPPTSPPPPTGGVPVDATVG